MGNEQSSENGAGGPHMFRSGLGKSNTAPRNHPRMSDEGSIKGNALPNPSFGMPTGGNQAKPPQHIRTFANTRMEGNKTAGNDGAKQPFQPHSTIGSTTKANATTSLKKGGKPSSSVNESSSGGGGKGTKGRHADQKTNDRKKASGTGTLQDSRGDDEGKNGVNDSQYAGDGFDLGGYLPMGDSGNFGYDYGTQPEAQGFNASVGHGSTHFAKEQPFADDSNGKEDPKPSSEATRTETVLPPIARHEPVGKPTLKVNPTNNTRNHRLAVAQYSTLNRALSLLPEYSLNVDDSGTPNRAEAAEAEPAETASTSVNVRQEASEASYGEEFGEGGAPYSVFYRSSPPPARTADQHNRKDEVPVDESLQAPSSSATERASRPSFGQRRRSEATNTASSGAVVSDSANRSGHGSLVGLESSVHSFGNWGAAYGVNVDDSLQATKINPRRSTDHFVGVETPEERLGASGSLPRRNTGNGAETKTWRPETDAAATAVKPWNSLMNTANHIGNSLKGKHVITVNSCESSSSFGGNGLRRVNDVPPSKWKNLKEMVQRRAEKYGAQIRKGHVLFDTETAEGRVAALTDGTLAMLSALPPTRTRKSATQKSENRRKDDLSAGGEKGEDDADGTSGDTDEELDEESNAALSRSMSTLWEENRSESGGSSSKASSVHTPGEQSDDSAQGAQPEPSGDWGGDCAPTVFRPRPPSPTANQHQQQGHHLQQPPPPQQRPFQRQNLWAMNAANRNYPHHQNAAVGRPVGNQRPFNANAAGPVSPMPNNAIRNGWQYQQMPPRGRLPAPGAPFNPANNNGHSNNYAAGFGKVVNGKYQPDSEAGRGVALGRKMPNSDVLHPQPVITGPPLPPMPKPSVTELFDYSFNDVPWVRSPKWEALKVADRMNAKGKR